MVQNVNSVTRLLGGMLLAAVLLATGCQSYTIMQRNVFADDDGNVVSVEYGRSEKDHVNTFKSPVNGEEMEFRSKLVVLAELPDGDSFKAWQCMNFLPYGTMYRTDDREWMLLANGFGCTIYHQTDEDETKYLEVYRGVLCDIDKDVKEVRNEKWRDVTRPGQKMRRDSEKKK